MITPTTYTCENILNEPQPNYRVRFKQGDSYYVITPPPGGMGPIIEDQTTGLGLDTFQLSELVGASNGKGVYTWLLYNTTSEPNPNIVVKRAMSVSEIGTKHLDILKDICRNKHLSTDTNPESINVYCAGELKMTKTEMSNGSIDIEYTINVLSGSYSDDVINPKDISTEFEDWLRTLFVTNSEVYHNVDIRVTIDKTLNTLINHEEMDYHDNFDIYIGNLLRNVRGLDVYKFNANTHKELFQRTCPRYPDIWQAKHGGIMNKYKFLRRLKPSDLEKLEAEQNAEVNELNAQHPIDIINEPKDPEMDQYKIVLNDPPLSYGGKSFKKNRTTKRRRKSKKQRKSKRRRRKSKRHRKSNIQKH